MPKLKPYLTWSALVLLLLLTGCAAGVERSYTGAARERQQVARLVIQSPAQLRAINGDTSFNRKILAGTLMDTRKVDFLPGTYELALYYNNEDASTWPLGATIRSSQGIKANVTFEAGKLYRVKSKLFANQQLSLWVEEYQDSDTFDSRAVKAKEKGYKLYKAGQYREALAQLEQAILHAPNYADAFYYSGWSHIELGQLDQAAAQLRMAMRLVPRDPYVYSALGWIYYQKKEYQTAAAYYEQGLAIRPAPGDFAYVGYCHLQIGRYDLAVSDFTFNLQLDGSDATSYNNRAVAYEKLGDHEKARQDRQAYQRLKR